MPDASRRPTPSTQSDDYACRLATLEGRRWRRWLDVQAPYRWHIRRLRPGLVLDVGCGIGRNLAHLHGRGVGIDHNPACVAIARSRGLAVYTPDEFARSVDAGPGRFDSLLVAHVLEHLDGGDATELLHTYLPYLRADGRLIVITPQEAGQRTDPTHVRFVDFVASRRLASALGWRVVTERSFPFPRAVGRVFPYNEFVVVCRRDRET